MARDRGLRVEVVVGEEVTTRGGHLLALFIDRPIRPYRSLRRTIVAVHDAGGLAVPAHPLVPYPLCAQGFVLRRLLDDSDPRVHPDGLETLNPTMLGRPVARPGRAFRRQPRPGPPRQQRRPRPRGDRDRLDDLPGSRRRRPAARHRDAGHRARQARSTARPGSWACSGASSASAARDARAEVRGRIRRDGTGRDHGYPAARAPRRTAVRAADPGSTPAEAGAVGRRTA